MPLHSGNEPHPRKSLNLRQPKIISQCIYKDMSDGDCHANKFEAAGPSLQPYKGMFTSVADMLSSHDMVAPAPSYTNSFTEWKEAAESVFNSLLEEAGEEDAEAARQIGFGILEKFIEKAGSVGWAAQTPEVRRLEVERLLALEQVPQRTGEWYAQGKSVLTASEFANIFGTPRAVRQLAFNKISPPTQQTNRLACPTSEMGPFDWGIRFEPVVKQILTERWGVKIMDSGRLRHPKDPLLAASPDGLILEASDPARVGRLIEIKCPITREIGDTIPFEYWCQMQVQMEVTGIDECEYVEVKIHSLSPKRLDLSGATPDGHVWLLQNPDTCLMMYAYTEAERVAAEAGGFHLLETVPWRLDKMHAKTVMRDRGWFEGTAKAREDFWAVVEQARRGEIQPFEVKARAKVVVTKEECRITD